MRYSAFAERIRRTGNHLRVNLTSPLGGVASTCGLKSADYGVVQSNSYLSDSAAGRGAAVTKGLECALLGKWRIIEADLWDRDYLDLVKPAQITFEGNGHGDFAFGCVNGGLDCEYSRRIIFFTWRGFDEMDEVGGDGSAELDDHGSLEIEIRFHLGDEAILKARKW